MIRDYRSYYHRHDGVLFLMNEMLYLSECLEISDRMGVTDCRGVVNIRLENGAVVSNTFEQKNW